MKLKIRDLIEYLYLNGFKGRGVSLTIDYEKILNEFEYLEFNLERKDYIIEILESYDKINSFNLTLSEKYNVDKLLNDFEDEDEDGDNNILYYWYQSDIVFHGESDIEIYYDFRGKSNGFRLDKEIHFNEHNLLIVKEFEKMNIDYVKKTFSLYNNIKFPKVD